MFVACGACVCVFASCGMFQSLMLHGIKSTSCQNYALAKGKTLEQHHDIFYQRKGCIHGDHKAWDVTSPQIALVILH